MKTILTFLVTLLLVSYSHAQEKNIVDNAELALMYKEDQADRTAGTSIEWSKVAERDRKREERVYEMLNENLLKTSNDYAHAAMIFQHGGDTVASGMAVKMMRKAVELDPSRNKWLLAAAIDRDLMYRKKPQIYGTQFRKEGEGQWVLYEIDETAVTDEERREYNVPPLKEARARAERMNLKKLSELYEENSMDEVLQFIRVNYTGESGFDLSENAINNFGYELMGEGKDEEALRVFKLNVELHPQAYNPWDSYGEILLKMDRKEEAVEAYEKSLELNPANTNARAVLENMR